MRADNSASLSKLKRGSVRTRLSKPKPLSSAGISSNEEPGAIPIMGWMSMVSSSVSCGSWDKFFKGFSVTRNSYRSFNRAISSGETRRDVHKSVNKEQSISSELQTRR